MNFKEFHKELRNYRTQEIVFVGLGNDYRGDDAAGLVFLKRLQRCLEFIDCHFICAGANPENYLEQILARHARIIVFIDAARFGARPGEIRWLDAKKIDTVKISTHAFSIKMVENYLLAHQELEFRYLGIEPQSTEINEGLSPVVAKAMSGFFE